METPGGSTFPIVQMKPRGSKAVCAREFAVKNFKKSLASFSERISVALPNENWAQRRVPAIKIRV